MHCARRPAGLRTTTACKQIIAKKLALDTMFASARANRILPDVRLDVVYSLPHLQRVDTLPSKLGG